MNGICEECFKQEDFVKHGDVAYIKLTDTDHRCIRCGKVCKCVEDYEFHGATGGMNWLMKNSHGWKEFKK